MHIDLSTRIARPIDVVWTRVADEFARIEEWLPSVVTSTPLEANQVPAGLDLDAPVAGRMCTFTDRDDGLAAFEPITEYNKAEYRLRFDAVPQNAPALLPVSVNHVTMQLVEVGPNETELQLHASPELKPHGYLMYPLVKSALTKTFGGLLDGQKEWVERDDPAAQAA